MSRINFTVARIAEFQCPSGKKYANMYDSAAPGLGVRVTENGAKSYIFTAPIRGRNTEARFTIGDVGTWRLPDARERARECKMLADKGIDPRSIIAERNAKEAAEQAEQKATTLKQKLTARTAWEEYLTARAKRWSERHYQDHVSAASEGGTDCKIGNRKSMAAPLASLLSRPLSEITADVVSDWLASESKKRPTFTQNAYRKFRAFVNWCTTHAAYGPVVNSNCCTAGEVKTLVPKKQTREGDCLERDQLRKWFASVRTIGNPIIAAYFQALLITGARRNEVLCLRWQDVDFEWRKMKIKDKVEGEREIALTPYLASILARLPRENEWVFSSATSESGHLESPTKAHNQALQNANLPHISLHGLRRSFGTLAEWVEAPSGVIAQIKGHKPSALAEKHYKRRGIDFLRLWHDKIEGWMLNEAGIKWKE